MKSFTKKVSFILIVSISLTTLISYGSLYILRHSSFYKPSFLVNTVYDNEFDYIILGASTGLTTLNTKVIDSVLQTHGLNLSMDDSALSSQFLMLQHFLAQRKTTRYCVLAPSLKDFDVENLVLSGNDYRFLMFNTTSYVTDYYKSFEGKQASILSNSKWFPFLGVSYYNVELFYPAIQSLFFPDKRNRFDNQGNYVYPMSEIPNKAINQFSEIEIKFKNLYLEKINELCKSHDIQLICYLSPIKGNKAICSSEEYLIINHSDLLKNEMYFYDTFHVDSRGRQLSSEHFAETFNIFLINNN